MAVSKNTIVITSKGPKGEKGAAVTVDGAAITSFSTVSVTDDASSVVADSANDTVIFSGSGATTLSSSGSTVTISSTDTDTTYTLDTAQDGANATITLTGSDASTDSITLAAGSNVTLTETGDTITIASTGGGGGGSVTVYDNGSALTTALSSLNFTGSGVTLSEPSADNITVNIPNGANSFGNVIVGAVTVAADSYGDTLTLNTTAGSAVALTGVAISDTVTINAYIQNETAPTLGAGLDVDSWPIYTTNTNGNVVVYGDGTGVVSLGSTTVNNNVNCSPGLVDVRNDGTDQSKVKLYCENETHYVQLKSPAHSGTYVSYDFVLPETAGTSGQFLQTDGSGNTTWATSSGSGATELNGLNDVTIGTPAAGEILINNATSGDFENATLTEGASVVITNADASITIDACQGQELNVTTRDSVDGAVSAAGEAEGIVVNFGNDPTTQGSVYTYASGTWTAVNASASGEATTKGLLGLALGTNSTTDGMLIQGVGYITHQNDATAAGEVLYIDTTAGEVSKTQPSASTQYVRVVGYALAAGGASGSKVFFSPSQDWIEIA